ncbi:MAG: 30S ribosomal protein S30e [Aigarchaeota archaeon]|nr:30S ribosomal protein S30e [Aigarchaeota archaeon]MDH5702902.1 30S ribosomal protein S30e [Aigarchaeota archaeon]
MRSQTPKLDAKVRRSPIPRIRNRNNYVGLLREDRRTAERRGRPRR